MYKHGSKFKESFNARAIWIWPMAEGKSNEKKSFKMGGVISEDDQKTEERSSKIQRAEGPGMVSREFHANEGPRSVERSDKVGPLVEVLRNLLMDFQNLLEHVISKKISLR